MFKRERARGCYRLCRRYLFKKKKKLQPRTTRFSNDFRANVMNSRHY